MSDWAYALAEALGGRTRGTRDGVLVQCPTHDDPTPSLHISELADASGKMRLFVHCFAGCKFNTLLPHLRATGQWDSSEARAFGGGPSRRPTRKVDPDGKWAGAGRPSATPRLEWMDGTTPEGLWEFRTARGAVSAYEVRYPRKRYRTWSWWRKDPLAPPRLIPRAPPPGTRTPWQCDIITAHPECTIIMLEGARTAEAAQALLPDLIATAWIGGVEAAHHTDWSALENRLVIMIPDEDPQGSRGMSYTAAVLARRGARLAWTPISEWCAPRAYRRKGFDAYDALHDERWTASEMTEARRRLRATHPLAL